MVLNPAGYQPVFDGGDPASVGGFAKGVISGGALVFASGANNVVSSGINSFATTDIEYATGASGAQFNGIAMNQAASGAAISVATKGAYIPPANAAVTAGFLVGCDGNEAVANSGSVAGNLAHQRTIGRALTSAASGGFAVVQLR